MNKFSIRTAMPYLLAIPIFYLVIALYLPAEVVEGMHLPQGDIQQFEGMKKMSLDYEKAHGEPALWNTAMFSGFPEYLITGVPDGPVWEVVRLTRGYFEDATAASAFFVCMIMFWGALLCFGVGPYMAILGAIAFTLNTFFVVSTEAGHMTKMFAIGYGALVLGGMSLVFRRKYLLGFAVFALALTLQVRANHLQITYYLAFVCAIYVLSEIYYMLKEKQLPMLTRMGAVLFVGVVLAGLTQTARLWMTKEYSNYSIRGSVELTPQNPAEKRSDGLDKEYAFSWSEGKLETLTLMVPRWYGGASSERPKVDGPFHKALESVAGKQRAAKIVKDKNFKLPMYYGDQPFTAGPMYMGAVICFLFVLSMLVLEDRHRWWMLAAVILTTMFAWGRNLAWFNYFMFDYFPGFNKFRSVSMALSLGMTIMPIAGFMGLQKVLSGDVEGVQKKLLTALGATAGLCLLMALGAGMVDTAGPNDAGMMQRMFGNDQRMVQLFVSAIEDERAALMRADAFRSAILILLAFAAVWFSLKGKLKQEWALLIVGVLAVGDLWMIDKNYLNDDDYVKQTKSVHVMSAADKAIKKDESNYRVMNLAASTFTEAATSYYHHSIGGYFAAKMRRYQDLIERELVVEQQRLIESLRGGQPVFAGLPAINMLNTKYVKIGNKATDVIPNPNALGNAWFVNSVREVNSADEEMAAVGQIDPASMAVVDISKFKVSGTAFATDSTASAKLVSFDNRHLTYETVANAAGLLVFSEIYYPEGWIVRIDGEEAEMIRANYVLRALEVPAGEHQVTFEFRPDSYFVGSKITLYASWVVFICFVVAVGVVAYRKLQAQKQ